MQSGADAASGKDRAAIRRILVASDLSAHSDRAFDRAAILAEQLGASLRFVHAIDRNVLPDRLVEANLAAAQAHLEQEVRDSGIDSRLDVTVKAVAAPAEKAVIDEAQAVRADLIVMGLSRDASLAGMVRGTTIDKVVRRADCPVLVVKARARRPYGRIVAAVDLAAPSRRALDVAVGAFPGAEFTVIHVDESVRVTPGREADAAVPAERCQQIEDMVAARFAAAGLPSPGRSGGPGLQFRCGRAVNVLPEALARLSPDLVVLGTHGRTGVAQLFLGSVAETLLEVLRHDVLVVRG